MIQVDFTGATPNIDVTPGRPGATIDVSKRGPVGPRGEQGPGVGETVASISSQRGLRALRAALGSGTARVVAMGDSKTEGAGVSQASQRWLNVLMGSLRARYAPTGDQGLGYLPAYYATFWGFPSAPTTSGSAATVGNGGGLGNRSRHLASGGSVTWTVPAWTSGVPLLVHWTQHPGHGDLEVVTGGTVRATIATGGAAIASKVTPVTVPAGTTSVTVRHKAGTGAGLAARVEGIVHRTSTTGVIVYDAARSGAKAVDYSEGLGSSGAPDSEDYHWQAVQLIAPHAVILAFGANDQASRTAAQWSDDLRLAVAKAKAAAPGAGVIVLHGAQRTEEAGDPSRVLAFEAAARAAVGADPDVSILYESSLWAPVVGEDYSDGDGIWLSDTVHTNATANQAIARMLLASITSVDGAADAAALARDAALAAAQTAASAPVTPDRATFVTVSKNLYNPSDATVGQLLSGATATRGQTVASASYTTTGFIPVTAGQSYAVSNPRNLVWYDASKATPVPAENFADNSSQAALVAVAPAGAAYLRASFYGATFQVEKGTAATAYVPYSAVLTGVTVPKDTTPIGPERTSFAVISKNLYNPADPDAATDVLLSSANGATTPLAGYKVTGFIPVTAGQAYTLTGARNITLYDGAKQWLGVTTGFIDNAAQTPRTVTPTIDGYLRASFHAPSYDATFQVEKGAAATAYTPYRVSVTALALPTLGGIRAVRSGTALTLTTDLGGQALTQAADLAGSANGGFNWTSTRLDGVLRHACADSITPLRTTMGTIGANHGFANVRSFANPDGKSTADLGSTWTDGTTTYTLLQISGGRLVLGGPAATGPNGGYTSANVAPTADLTHVSGATHTGTISRTGLTAVQLYPSVKNMTVTATLDGAPLTDGAESQGSVLRVVESYEILDYADLIAKAQANVGTPYTSLNVAGAVRVANLYEMRAPGTWLVSTTITALLPQFLYVCGFVQSEQLTVPSGGSVWRWVPGVKPIGGLDWHAGVNLASLTTNQYVTTADLLDTSKPPTWMTEWARDSAGKDVLGFAHGYAPDKSDGSWTARVASGATNFWDLRNSKKSYPTTFTSKALSAGQRVSVQAWRAYLPPDARGVAVEDAQAAYAYAIGTSASARPTPMSQQVGRTITPLIEQGLTVAPGIVDADGLTVSGTGHAIAKLT